MAKDKRVEVLFEPSEYRTLEQVARRDGKPVGAVIREAVSKYVTESDRKKRREALEWLLSQEPIPLPPWEELKEEMARAEYDDMIKSVGYDPFGEELNEAD